MPALQQATRPSTIGYEVYGTRMDDTEGTRGGMSLNVDRQAVKRSATASTAQHEAGEQGNRRRWLNALFCVVGFAGRGFSTVPTRGNRGSRGIGLRGDCATLRLWDGGFYGQRGGDRHCLYFTRTRPDRLYDRPASEVVWILFDSRILLLRFPLPNPNP
jgi:hypothetical protein